MEDEEGLNNQHLTEKPGGPESLANRTATKKSTSRKEKEKGKRLLIFNNDRPTAVIFSIPRLIAH